MLFPPKSRISLPLLFEEDLLHPIKHNNNTKKKTEAEMGNEEEIQTPGRRNPSNESSGVNGGNNGRDTNNTMLSPRFRSVAAMAGWDEEAILLATLVVEDTPERQRESKHKKRINLQFKTPPTNSRRKRRPQRGSPSPPSLPPVVLNLDDEETSPQENENGKKKVASKVVVVNVMEEKKKGEERKDASPPAKTPSFSSGLVLPCIDRLREELSCAICLEICFEPSTTPCGHSFCKKCLRSAADKCGKRCPKCRQLIGNGRSCTVNTVLWNTIQLLFPQEVKARKGAGAASSREVARQSLEKHNDNVRSQNIHNVRSRSTRSFRAMNADDIVGRRRGMPSQNEDAALALRLQRDEFMGTFRGAQISSARANLRAMAARAIDIRNRGRQT